MAHSRLEKIGTIYTRTRGLMQSGALSFTDRPLWFDIYEAFPPTEEPRFDRPLPNMQIKQIFYEEDTVRAQLHRNLGRVGTVHLLNQHTTSFTQKFIKMFRKLENQYGVGECEPDKLYNEALEMLKKEREAQLQADGEEPIDGTLTSAFMSATNQQQRKVKVPTTGVSVKDLFKD